MGLGRTVRSPDGERWRVRRRWTDKPLQLRRRWIVGRREVAESSLDGLWGLDLLNGASGLVAVGVAALLVIVLLPLLGVALELIFLLLVILSGLAGRILLGRPWIVEAENLDHRSRSLAFAVRGWTRSRTTVAELATALEASGAPVEIPSAEPVQAPSRRS
jgi:hypothetical protein